MMTEDELEVFKEIAKQLAEINQHLDKLCEFLFQITRAQMEK